MRAISLQAVLLMALEAAPILFGFASIVSGVAIDPWSIIFSNSMTERLVCESTMT